MKQCNLCGEHKPLDAFYLHPKTLDGRQARCKECHKAAMRKRREDNLEQIKAYDRARGNLPHRVAARAEYQKTDAYRRSHNAASTRYIDQNPKRRAAHIAVGNAIRDGRLVPTPCVVCGAERVEGHHPDYDAPLDVVWLCTSHHVEAHQLVEN